MAKAVFTTRVDPGYDDLPEERYHFPDHSGYLATAKASVGDWIIFYEPRRLDDKRSGGRQAYFGTARVVRIRPDLNKPDHFYADLEDFLPFDRPVPFKDGEHYYEAALRKVDGSTNKGAFGHALREVSEAEYDLILRAGFATVIGKTVAFAKPGTIAPRLLPAVEEEGAEFERPIVESLVHRPFRDRAFATGVVTAYDKTCAVTGLQIINGGGRPEVQAAHIRAVESGGSDSIRNGVALSGTVHWMFDRGLISIDDDYSVLVADKKLPEAARQMIRHDRKLILPKREDLRPHRTYLKFHRENVFKG
jgi:putative restriction endonuclease